MPLKRPQSDPERTLCQGIANGLERAPRRFVLLLQKVIHRKSPKKPKIVDKSGFFRIAADFLEVIHKSSYFLGYFVDK